MPQHHDDRPVTALLAVLLAFPPASAPAQPPASKPEVDSTKVNLAISRGGEYLLGVVKKGIPESYKHPQVAAPIHRDELILYAMIYAGVDRSDPDFQKLLNRILDEDIHYTYHAALQALALEALDPQAFQPRIAQCAQFLVDNQCENGQWGYGKAVSLPKLSLTGAASPAKKTLTEGGKPGEIGAAPAREGAGAKKRLPRITIQRRGEGPKTGDNSNTQYALLGIRACCESGILVPADVLAKAESFWDKNPNKDKGWGYALGTLRKDSYASMTEGAVGSLAVAMNGQGKDFRTSLRLQEGLQWLADNFSVTEVAKTDKETSGRWLYYHLYALERAGILAGVERIGSHDWYAEGATWLLGQQAAGGSWAEAGGGDPITDTCYAILFLKRATKPLPMVRTNKG